MVALLIAGVAGAVLVLYAADLVLRARARARRLREMSDRLAAAAARAEQQYERRRAAAQASKALTSVIPAIQRPPPSMPGVPPGGADRSAGDDRAGLAGRDS